MLKNMFSCPHRKGKNWLTHYNHQCLHSQNISARGFSIESMASLDLSHKDRGEKRCSFQAWLSGPKPELCYPEPVEKQTREESPSTYTKEA